MARPITQLTDTFKIFRDNVNTISNNVGDPTNLTTTQDSDLVTAVNELDSDLHGSGGGSVKSSLTATSYASSAIGSGLVGAFNAVDAFIGGDSSVLPTTATTLVYAIKEIDEDIHGVGGGSASSDLTTDAENIVDAINEIESVFDASQTQIVSGDDFSITVTSGDLSMVASGDATIDVDGGLTLSTGSQISLQKNSVQYGSLSDSATHLLLKTGTGLVPALKFDSANAYMLNTLFTDSALDTTAKSVAGGVNELHGRVTTLEDSVGSGGLDTVAQTLVGGINELDSEMGELSNLSAYFDGSNNNIVIALNALGADVNELDSRVTAIEDSIGSGGLDTVAQTLVGGINELDSEMGELSNLDAYFNGSNNNIVIALNALGADVLQLFDSAGVLDERIGSLANLSSFFDSDAGGTASIVAALNYSSGVLDERIGSLANLSSFFDSGAGGTASIVAALNYMASRVIDIYDENGVLLNT